MADKDKVPHAVIHRKNQPTSKPESVVVNNVAKDADAISYVPASAAAGKEGIRVILTLE